MVERALAFDHDPVPEALALLDEPLDRALREVADQPIDGHPPALDHHPGLPGRHERGLVTGRQGRAPQLERDRHLADRAVAADREDHSLPGPMPPPDGRLHPVRRPAVVDDAGATCRRCRPELGVIAQERVQPGQDVETGRDRLEDDRPPGVRQPAAGRGDADQQRIGRVRERERLGQASRRSGCRGRADTPGRSAPPSSNRAPRRRRHARSG